MILVTGTTGILGRTLVLELLKQGKSVRATRRPTSKLNDAKQTFSQYGYPELFEKIDWVDFNIDDVNSISNSLKGITEIYHCAAYVSFNPKDKDKMQKTNIEGTKKILDVAKKNNIQKFCFISSISVFDGLNEQGETDESCAFNPNLEHSAYAISKHLSEKEVLLDSKNGLNSVIVNPGVIIGSGNWNNSSGTLFKSFEQLPFSFSGGTSYVDVRDVAKICTELMDKNIFNEKFILVSENKLFREVSSIIRKKLGKSEPLKFPYFLLKFGQFLNFLFGWLIPPLKMLNKTNIDAISEPSHYSNKKIIERLNYKFISVEESINFHIKNYINKDK